jgi:hypothetical protein
MEADELDDRIAALERDRDRQRQEFDRLKREHDALANKLRYPGTKFLVDLEYKLVYEDTITVGAVSLHVEPPFETLPGTIHAIYALSAYAPSSNTPVVIGDGSVIVAPSDAVSIGIHRQRATSPTAIEASVVLYNSGAVEADIAVRVWRRLGMGS